MCKYFSRQLSFCGICLARLSHLSCWQSYSHEGSVRSNHCRGTGRAKKKRGRSWSSEMKALRRACALTFRGGVRLLDRAPRYSCWSTEVRMNQGARGANREALPSMLPGERGLPCRAP
jgi:hypothetical protein